MTGDLAGREMMSAVENVQVYDGNALVTVKKVRSIKSKVATCSPQWAPWCRYLVGDNKPHETCVCRLCAARWPL